MRCTLCEVDVPEDSLFGHVEEVHIGPSEEMKLVCATCPFSVVRDRIDLMASHCLLLGHDPAAVRSDWVREEQRTLNIFRIVYQMIMVRKDMIPATGPQTGFPTGIIPSTGPPPTFTNGIHHQPPPAKRKRGPYRSLNAAKARASPASAPQPSNEETNSNHQINHEAERREHSGGITAIPSAIIGALNLSALEPGPSGAPVPGAVNGSHSGEGEASLENSIAPGVEIECDANSTDSDENSEIPADELGPSSSSENFQSASFTAVEIPNTEYTPEELILQAIPVSVSEPARDPQTLLMCCLCDQEIVAFHRNRVDGKPSLKIRFLANHVLTHHLKDVRPFYCTGCTYSSARPDKIKVHVNKCQLTLGKKSQVAGGINDEHERKIRDAMKQAFPTIDVSNRKIGV